MGCARRADHPAWAGWVHPWEGTVQFSRLCRIAPWTWCFVAWHVLIDERWATGGCCWGNANGRFFQPNWGALPSGPLRPGPVTLVSSSSPHSSLPQYSTVLYPYSTNPNPRRSPRSTFDDINNPDEFITKLGFSG